MTNVVEFAERHQEREVDRIARNISFEFEEDLNNANAAWTKAARSYALSIYQTRMKERQAILNEGAEK